MPLWIGKDFADDTSLFGGGGYEINPGQGNRSFWQAAAALTHDVNDKWSVGAELTRQGSDTMGGTAQTRAGVGSIVKLSDHDSLLFSGGPTWADHRTGYHIYGALGLFFWGATTRTRKVPGTGLGRSPPGEGTSVAAGR